MAEETLLLKLKIETDPKTPKTINDLIKRNKELAKILKDAPREGTEAYEKQREELEKARKEYAKNRQEILKFNKELRNGEKEIEAQEGSLNQLSKSLKALEKEYRNLSAEERKTARGKELQANIKKTRAELLKAEKAVGDFRRQVGNYTRSLAVLNSGFGGVAISIGQLKEGLGGLVTAFRQSSAAAKAFLLTLGPISILIATITVALSKFQSVIDSVSSTLSGVSATFDVLAERFGRLGGAFQNLLSFDFSGFAREAQDAFRGIGTEIANDFQQAQQLQTAFQSLRDQEINSIVRLAELERDIADAKQTSAENEKTNRDIALEQIERAIELTAEQEQIELGLARERQRILEQQVNLSAETTSAEDRRALAEATADVIRLETQFLDETTALIRRRERLRKVEKDNNKAQIDELERLQKRQSELTKEIRLRLLTGQEVTEQVTELKNITQQLLEVDEKFKELTEGVTDAVTFASDSIKGFNERLNALNEELESVSVTSERYKEIQTEIAQVEAERASATGELAINIDALNKAQLENLQILEDSETEIRLRAEALKELESIEGDSTERARRRLEIEKEVEREIRQVRLNRISDQKEELRDELIEVENNLKEQIKIFADNEIKKQEIQLIAQGKRDEIRKRELELEKQLLDISKKNFDESEKEKTASLRAEEQRRKELRDLAIETSIEASQKVLELLSTIQAQATEKQAEEINKREEAELAEAELVGKTEAEKQKIRNKFEAEREALERKSANERKALAIAEATIDIAGAVIKSLNSPAPGNVALAASTAALGALQLAIITATNFADGGLVIPVQLESGRIINTPNIRQMKNGDNIFATVRRGEVILNEAQQRALGGSETFRRIGVPGFAQGGKVDLDPIAKASPFARGGMSPIFSTPIVTARAFQSGGLSTLDATQSVKRSIEAENNALTDGIEKAVFKGSALGTKEGAESADISQQIARQNEREQRRKANESF